MASAAFSRAVDGVAEPLERLLPESLKSHSKTVVLIAGGSVAYLTLRRLTGSFYKSNPFNFGRTGALSADEINKSIVDYEKFFDQKQGAGIKDGQVAGKKKSNTPEFVDKFYRHAARARAGPQRRPAAAGCQASAVRRRCTCAAAGRCRPHLHAPTASAGAARASSRGGRATARAGSARRAGRHARSARPQRLAAAGRRRAARRPCFRLRLGGRTHHKNWRRASGGSPPARRRARLGS